MKSLFYILPFLLLLTSCNNQSPTPTATPTAADASAILKHKYWVSKEINDALFAANISDTLSYLPCGELVFDSKDTVLMTSCLSDAGRGVYKATSATSLEIAVEGFEGKPSVAKLDEKTGILHLDPPGGPETGWPTEYVAQDDIAVSNIDEVTLLLGRKRLAGKYAPIPQKGQTAPALELRADGTQVGLGDFDKYEPWIAGIGGGSIYNPARNVMYLVKKGKEGTEPTLGWQLRGDTLRLWETKNTAEDGDMPEFKITKLKGTYLKSK